MLISCQEKLVFDSQDEFETYVSNNKSDFVVKTEMSDFYFESMMVPPIKSDTAEQRLFRLRIGLKDGTNVLDYAKGNNEYNPLQKEGYLSFDVINDVFLLSDGKEIHPSFHHYERNYGIKPTLDLVFFFNHVSPKSKIQFCYRDMLFNQGLVKIEFNKELFTNCYVEK